MSNYEVYFYDPENDSEVRIYRSDSVSDAVRFALALHDGANVEHSVLVRRGCESVCTLVLEAKLR